MIYLQYDYGYEAEYRHRNVYFSVMNLLNGIFLHSNFFCMREQCVPQLFTMFVYPTENLYEISPIENHWVY